MPIDAPTLPGECEVSLSGAVVTSAFCQNPANAFDNDPTTAAAFVPVRDGGSATVTVAGNKPTWTDTLLDIAAGATLTITKTGLVNWGSSFSPSPAYAAAYGCRYLNLAICVVPEPFVPQLDGRPPVGGGVTLVYPPKDKQLDGTYSYVVPVSGRVYVAFNDLYGTYSDNTGSYNVALAATAPPFSKGGRFTRADWGATAGDRFINKIRLRMAGAGNANAAVALESSALESSLGAGNPDVPIAYFPLPSDEAPGVGVTSVDGSGVHEISFDPPVLARGVSFYPDYLAGGIVNTGAVSLYQLQVYEQKGTEIMVTPLPTIRRARVAVTASTLYPWNGSAGPYDATTGCILEALESLEGNLATKDAVVKGGENLWDLNSYETEREQIIKIMYAVSDLRVMQLLFGGTLVVNQANAPLGEVQYWSANKSDRAPYVRLVAASANGDGKETLVWPKLKVTGQFGYKVERDKVTVFDLSLRSLWDNTYVRQDGQIGGIFEMLFGANGETAMHSMLIGANGETAMHS